MVPGPAARARCGCHRPSQRSKEVVSPFAGAHLANGRLPHPGPLREEVHGLQHGLTCELPSLHHLLAGIQLAVLVHAPGL